ncbi:hypothetical protein GA0061084_2548 [Arthrobacter sp. NIO-1057]|nr:hypothetical protein GA0061084_2548 [Arthrobacter sp. NIO-1057]
MKTKSRIVSVFATVGLSAGILLSASPAQAYDHYWVSSFDTKAQCQATTLTKIAGLSVQKKKIVSTKICTYYKGEYKPYFSMIRYR